MTKDTLVFLRELLLGQTIPVSAPNFRKTAETVATALDELNAAIAEVQEVPPSA